MSAYNMHRGTPKSGPWLLSASTPDDGWQRADWRNAPDYGAFSSTSRPATSGDIPHPSKLTLKGPSAQRAAQTEDPENDPYGVLNGTGKSFGGLVNNIVSHYGNASPETRYEGRVWYPAAREHVKDVSDKTIHDPNRTAAVFAALSPQNDWDNNVEHGTHFMLHYTGDPNFGMPRILGGNVDKAKEIYHSPTDDYGAILNGPKTRSFHHNILDPTPLREGRPGEHDDQGYFQHQANPHTGEQDWRMDPDQDVTADTHHARATSTPHGGDLSRAEYQVPADFSYSFANGGKKIEAGYDLYNRATQEATRRINAAEPDPARHLTPKQVQAIIWTKFKDDVDNAGKGRDFNPPGTPPKGLQKWLDKGKSEEEWAAKNPSQSEHPVIPRYQRERDPEYWTDEYRRPDPNIRQAPGYANPQRFKRQVAAVANNGSLWGKVLGNYINRNPQHPNAEAPKSHRPHRTPRRTLMPRGNPNRTPDKLYRQHGTHLDTPGQITGSKWYTAAPDYRPHIEKKPADTDFTRMSEEFGPMDSMITNDYKVPVHLHPEGRTSAIHDWEDTVPEDEARIRLRQTLADQGTRFDSGGMTHALQEYNRMRDDYHKHGRWYTATPNKNTGINDGINGGQVNTSGAGTSSLPGMSDAPSEGYASTWQNAMPIGLSSPSGGGGGGHPAAGGSAGGPASVVPTGSGAVPLVRNPDGSYTSPDPAWAHLINRESGGHNIIQSPSTHDVNSGGNEAFGLFQITPGTWSSHGGQGSVYNSTPEQQAQVAADIIRKNPSGSDWGAGMSGRENASALMQGLGH